VIVDNSGLLRNCDDRVQITLRVVSSILRIVSRVSLVETNVVDDDDSLRN
jgi:hypothetical protein